MIIHLPSRQWTQFQERRIRITQQLDALTRQQFVALAVFGNCIRSTSLLHLAHPLIKLLDQLLKSARILLIVGTVTLYLCFDDAHKCLFLSTALSVGDVLRGVFLS